MSCYAGGGGQCPCWGWSGESIFILIFFLTYPSTLKISALMSPCTSLVSSALWHGVFHQSTKFEAVNTKLSPPPRPSILFAATLSLYTAGFDAQFQFVASLPFFGPPAYIYSWPRKHLHLHWLTSGAASRKVLRGFDSKIVLYDMEVQATIFILHVEDERDIEDIGRIIRPMCMDGSVCVHLSLHQLSPSHFQWPMT